MILIVMLYNVIKMVLNIFLQRKVHIFINHMLGLGFNYKSN